MHDLKKSQHLQLLPPRSEIPQVPWIQSQQNSTFQTLNSRWNEVFNLYSIKWLKYVSALLWLRNGNFGSQK